MVDIRDSTFPHWPLSTVSSAYWLVLGSDEVADMNKVTCFAWSTKKKNLKFPFLFEYLEFRRAKATKRRNILFFFWKKWGKEDFVTARRSAGRELGCGVARYCFTVYCRSWNSFTFYETWIRLSIDLRSMPKTPNFKRLGIYVKYEG